MALAGLRNATVTPDDHGPLVAIATWFLMVAMILSVLIRVAVRFIITRHSGREDALTVVAMICGVGQSIAVSIAIQHGLGQRQKNLSSLQLANVERAEYAADLLYIVTICLAKLSVLQLLRRLAVPKSQKNLADVTSIVVVLWFIPAFLSLTFQCGVSHPWDMTSGHCIDTFVFWVAISPVDILTELVMISLPVLMMLPVQVAVSKKVVVIVAFIFRILVIVATIFRLFCLRPDSSSSDVTFSVVNSSIATQCVMSLSVITACIPCLKPFLDSFDSGMLGISFSFRSPHITNGNNYRMRTFGNVKDSSLHSPSQENNFQTLGYSAAAVATHTERRQSRGQRSGSISSTKSDAMIIRRTDQWKVQYENKVSQVAPQSDAEEMDTEQDNAVHSTV